MSLEDDEASKVTIEPETLQDRILRLMIQFNLSELEARAVLAQSIHNEEADLTEQLAKLKMEVAAEESEKKNVANGSHVMNAALNADANRWAFPADSGVNTALRLEAPANAVTLYEECRSNGTVKDVDFSQFDSDILKIKAYFGVLHKDGDDGGGDRYNELS